MVTDANEMHFYGQVVIHKNKDDKKSYIIDGQQRITTSYFIIRAFLTVYGMIKFKKGEEKQEKALSRYIYDIESLIGYNSVYDVDSQKLKLTQNDLDNGFFVKLICHDEDTIKEKISNKKSSKFLMKSALVFFESKVKSLIKGIKNNDEKIDVLNKYYNSFTNMFRFMYLEDDDLNEAYTIFETLNDRGRDLTSSDLLKNYILANSVDVDKSYAKWNEISANLVTLDITKFIRSVWNSSHNFAREKALYSSITADLQRSATKCDALLVDLKNCSQFYHDILDPYHPRNIENKDFLDCMKALKTMRTLTWCPVLLAMYSKKDGNGKKKYNIETDLLDVAKVIESFAFKNLFVCHNNPNEAEIDFAELAKNISLNNLSKEEIIKAISDKIVNGTLLDESLKLLTFSDSEEDKEKIRQLRELMKK